MGFHFHPLPHQRNLKIVIKCIPYDIINEEIIEKLKNLGFKSTFIRTFVKNGKIMPIHMVILANLEIAKEIYNLPDLFYVCIKVESYRSSSSAQCFSYQDFGHSSMKCGHPPRCVKCGGDHSTKICIKPKEDKPKFCNYNGEHTSSNYRGCPYYIDLIKKKNLITKNPKIRNKTTLPPTNPVHPALPSTKPTENYSKVTQGAKNPSKLKPEISATKIINIIEKLL